MNRAPGPAAPDFPESKTLGDLVLACALLFVAGYVDAVGFLTLRHYFISFMSGDSTQFAVSFARGRVGDAIVPITIVGSFVLGVVLGRLISRAAGDWRRPAILILECLLLAISTGTGPHQFRFIGVLALAMGVQNAAIHKAGQTKLSLTYVTGTLVKFGEALADAPFAEHAAEHWAWLPYLLFWLALLVGAMCGSLGSALSGINALWVPALTAAFLSVLTARSCLMRIG